MSELHQAVMKSDLEAVKLLLCQRDIDVNSRDLSGVLMFTPLHVAARRGDVKVLRCLLLDPRVDIEARDATKCTALRHAMGTGQLASATELLVAGADAKSGLLPFIMLDGYNHLIAFLQRSIAELEAQLQPHRLLRHRLALLLHKHGIPPPYTRQQQQQGQQPQPQPQPQPQQQQLVGPAVPIKDNQQRQQQQQQQQESPRLAMLRGAQRDAVELEQAATSIKQLRAELARVQHPISASMSHAIVSLVKACREYNAADDDIVPV